MQTQVESNGSEAAMSRVEDQRNTEVYAIVPMQFGQVNLYPAMDHLMETVAEGTENNMIAYQGARIKQLLERVRAVEREMHATDVRVGYLRAATRAGLRDNQELKRTRARLASALWAMREDMRKNCPWSYACTCALHRFIESDRALRGAGGKHE